MPQEGQTTEAYCDRCKSVTVWIMYANAAYVLLRPGCWNVLLVGIDAVSDSSENGETQNGIRKGAYPLHGG